MALPKATAGIGGKIKKLLKRDTEEMTKDEIIEEYRTKMLVSDIPTPIYEAMEKKVHDEWKQKLNPDLLFNSMEEVGGFAKLLPWIQIAVAIITLVFVATKK